MNVSRKPVALAVAWLLALGIAADARPLPQGLALSADFKAEPRTGNAPMDVRFLDLSAGTITSWQWDFGDGNTSTRRSPLHRYAVPGDFTVRLTITNGSGSDVLERTDYVSLTAPPAVADFVASGTTGARPYTVQFTDTSQGLLTNWQWDFGDGTTTTVRNPVHTFQNPGSYSVRLTVLGFGETDTMLATDYIQVTPPHAAIVRYGCGVNPFGSLQIAQGLPEVLNTIVFEIDNPLGTQSPGSLPILVLSQAPASGFPCGVQLPGFGMSGPGAAGELLVRFGPYSLPYLFGSTWAGPGNPSTASLTVPNEPALIGHSLWAQAILWDFTGNSAIKFGLTDGLELQFGI